MPSTWLTELQRQFLSSFFAAKPGGEFFLTGGTALSAFYLHHRLSADLDLFTLDEVAMAEASLMVPDLATALGCRLGRVRRTEHFSHFLFEPLTGEPLLVELVRDVGPQFGRHQEFHGVVVDSLENIAANKVTAILGRTEAKDFVDLYFLLQAGLDFDDLVAKARAKDSGLTPFFLAGSLLQVRSLPRLPETWPPLSMAELEASIVPLADRLVDAANPGLAPA